MDSYVNHNKGPTLQVKGMYRGQTLQVIGMYRGQTLQVIGMYRGQTLQVDFNFVQGQKDRQTDRQSDIVDYRAAYFAAKNYVFYKLH